MTCSKSAINVNCKMSIRDKFADKHLLGFVLSYLLAFVLQAHLGGVLITHINGIQLQCSILKHDYWNHRDARFLINGTNVTAVLYNNIERIFKIVINYLLICNKPGSCR